MAKTKMKKLTNEQEVKKTLAKAVAEISETEKVVVLGLKKNGTISLHHSPMTVQDKAVLSKFADVWVQSQFQANPA